MAYNKILFGDTPVIDLTQVTATDNLVIKDRIYHRTDGTVGVGTLELNISVEEPKLILPGKIYAPPDWSDGSNEEILKAIHLHYDGYTDLTQFWSVGDERRFTIEEIGDIVFELKEFTYTGDCIFTVESKYIPFNHFVNQNRHSGYTWDKCNLRTYLNDTVYNLFGDMKEIFREYKSSYNVIDRFSIPTDGGIKTDEAGNALPYWTGNRYGPDWAQYYYIDKNGALQHNYTDYSYGVVMIGAI